MDESAKLIIDYFNVETISLKDDESLVWFQKFFNNLTLEQKINYLNLEIDLNTKLKNMFFIEDQQNLSKLILIVETAKNVSFLNDQKYLILDKIIFKKENIYINSINWHIDDLTFSNFSKQDFKKYFESLLLEEKIKLFNLDEQYYLNKLLRIEIDFTPIPSTSFVVSFILKSEYIFSNNQNIYQDTLPLFKKQIFYIDDFNVFISPFDLNQSAFEFIHKIKMPYFFKEKLMFLGLLNNIDNDKIFRLSVELNQNINRVDASIYLNEDNLFKSNNVDNILATSRLFEKKIDVIQIPRININNFIYLNYSSLEFLSIFTSLENLKDQLSIIGLYNSYFEDALDKINININRNNNNIIDFIFNLKTDFSFSTRENIIVISSNSFNKESTLVIIENIDISKEYLIKYSAKDFVDMFNALPSIEQKQKILNIKINLTNIEGVFSNIESHTMLDNPYEINIFVTLKEQYQFYNHQQRYSYVFDDFIVQSIHQHPKLNIKETDYALNPKYFMLKLWSFKNNKDKLNYIGIYDDDFINKIEMIRAKKESNENIIIFDFILKNQNLITLKSKPFRNKEFCLNISNLEISQNHYQKNLWSFLENFYSSNLEAQLDLLGQRNKENIEGIAQIIPQVNLNNLININFTFIAKNGFFFINNKKTKTLCTNNFVKYNQILPIPPININLDFFSKEINYINEYLEKASNEEKIFFLGLDIKKYILGIENITFTINTEQNNKFDIYFKLANNFFFPNGLETYLFSSNSFLPPNKNIAVPFIHVSNYDQTSIEFIEKFKVSNLYGKMKSIGLINQECEKYCRDIEAFVDGQDHNRVMFKIMLHKNNSFNFSLKDMFLSSFPFRPWNLFVNLPIININNLIKSQKPEDFVQQIQMNSLETNLELFNINEYELRKNIANISAQLNIHSNNVVIVTFTLRTHVLFTNYKNQFNFNISLF